MSRTPKEDSASAQKRKRSVHSRRKFLTGAGVAIALPTLVSVMPKSLRAQADRPQRLLTLYHPNGTPLSKPDMYAYRSAIHPEIRAVFDAVAHRMSIAKNLNGNACRESIRAWSDHQHMQCYLSLYRGIGLESIGAETKTFDQYIAEDERHQGSRRNSISINLGMQDIDHVKRTAHTLQQRVVAWPRRADSRFRRPARALRRSLWTRKRRARRIRRRGGTADAP